MQSKSCSSLCLLLLLAGTLSASDPKSARPTASSSTTAITFPRVVRFSGTLPSGGDAKVVGVTFALYKDQTGGTPLWQEVQNVRPDGSGHYSVLLGSARAEGLPGDLFTGNDARWLAVRIENGAEEPRVQLVSVPYALKAGDAETLGGVPLSSFVLNQPTDVNISKVAAANIVPVAPSTPVAMDIASSTGTTNQVARWTDSITLGNSQLFDNGTNVGIGTTTPAAKLDVNGGAIFRGFATTFATTLSFGPQFDFTNNATPTAAHWRFGIPGTANATSFFIYDYVSQNAPFTMEKGAGANSLYFKAGGNVGIGTSTPGSKLVVAGTIESTTGGIKFPDASVQTKAAVGTLTGVTAGTGLLGGGTSGTVPLNADLTALQARVTGACTAGTALASVAANGTVSCNTITGGVGTITGVTAGTGLSGGGTSGTVSLGTDFTSVQARVAGTCSSGTALASIAANGTVSCNTISGGGGSLTLPFTGTGADNPPSVPGVFVVTDTENGPVNAGQPDPATIPAALLGVGAGTGVVSGVIAKTTGQDGVPLIGLSTSATANDVPVIVAWSQATSGKLSLLTGLASSPDAKGIDFNFTVTPRSVISASIANGNNFFSVDGTGNLFTNGSITTNAGINANGDIHSQGTISANVAINAPVKNFKIDHPLDPGNKWLYHASIESPDMKNLYDGVAVLDAHGEAWVTMPDWFEALNRDFRYQLTAIGAAGPKLYVANEVSGNRFKIAGGKRGMKVSWQVTGIRQDAWAADNRTQVEQEKRGLEIGAYYHPKLVTPANSTDANVLATPVR